MLSPCAYEWFRYYRFMHNLKRFFSYLAKALTMFFAFLTLAIVLISFLRPEWIKDAITWIEALIKTLGNWNYLVAFSSACIESLPIIGTAVPGMNIMILVWGFWGKTHLLITIVVAIFGAMLGNYLGYWIGKWYGTEIIERYGDWIGLGKTETNILHGQIEKNGFWYIVLGKFHNFTRSFVPFIAWANGMKEWNFWIYNMIGSIVWAVSVNLLGIFFIDNYESILDNLGKIMLVIIVWVWLYIYFFQRDGWNRYMRDKRKEIEDKIEQKEKRRAKRKNELPQI